MLDVTLTYHHPWRFYVASSTTKNSNNTKNLVVVVNVIPKCLKFFETLGPCLFISLRITTKDILLLFIYIFQIQEETCVKIEWSLFKIRSMKLWSSVEWPWPNPAKIILLMTPLPKVKKLVIPFMKKNAKLSTDLIEVK